MFFDELKDSLKRLFQSRIFHLVIVSILLFSILVKRLFVLQIVNGSSYSTDFTAKTAISYSVSGARGNIYDRNGVLLAYNELAYTIKICDSGRYEDNEAKNLSLNEVIYKMIHIIEDHNDTVDIDFPITIDEYGEYVFSVDEDEKLRFFRDIFGKTSVSLLSDEERRYSAIETIEYLSERYGVDEKYDMDDTIKIIYFRNLMKNNSYQRYLEFTVATEVSDETVAAILENSEELTGVSVAEDYVRKYVNSTYFAHIIGYTGRVSQDALVELQAKDEQYEANDVVGKIGIEEALELELTGRKGEKSVYIDSVGRVTEVISETSATRGNDVYLSIDADLQIKVYDEIERQLASILLKKIVPGGEESRYIYNSYGIISDINIPIGDVYFALINNNIISMSTLNTEPTDLQKKIHQKFVTKQNKVIEWLDNELKNSDTALGDLKEEYRIYEYYVYQYLLNNGIITSSNLDTDDPVYIDWYDEVIGLKEFLTYAISKNWVDLSMFTENEYQSLYEAYESLLAYVFENLPQDQEFCKRIYKYLIKDGTIKGSDVCAVLFEQGVIEYNESDYKRVKSGSWGAYDFIRSKIENLEVTPAQLALKPCSASVVVTSPVTGELLALVTYPSYDNNLMSGIVDPTYYAQLRNDKSLPLINRATASQCAPGSTYKINTTIAGVTEGVLSLNDNIRCNAIFDKVNPSPKCWVAPGAHGSLDIVGGIKHSCNIFFYEVGYRLSSSGNGVFSNELGTSKLQKYAELLGLATKSGIEIYEASPNASTINSVASAIGQGSNSFAPINLARYVTTIAARGTVYNFSLISKVVSNDEVKYSYTPDIANECDFVSDKLWDTVHEGMRQVLATSKYYKDVGCTVAGKTGTAQEVYTEPNHALMISFAPYESPEVCVTSVIQNGYISTNSSILNAAVLKIYFNQELPDKIETPDGNEVTD